MFKHEYQGGPCVEVFSAQGKEGKHSQWTLAGSGIKKVFDKEVKSFIFTLEGTTLATKIQLPKEIKQTLGLTQGMLVLQVNVPHGHDFAVDLGLLDSAEQKCRLAFSTAFKEMQITALHVKVPLAIIKRNVWINLCLDLRSLVQENLKTTCYKSLESISISGNCKLRRIFTMRNQAPDTTDDDELYGIPDTNAEVELESIPKQCQLTGDVNQVTQVINCRKLQYYEGKGKSSQLPSTSRNTLVHETDVSSSVSATDGLVAYHIAFGSKVPVPNRRQPLKEGNATSRATRMTQVSDPSAESTSSIQVYPSEECHNSETVCKKPKKPQTLEANVIEPSVTKITAEKLKSSHVPTGGSSAAAVQVDDVSSVKPHPPRKPSSEKPSRRRLRIKSTGHDPRTGSDRNPAVNNNESVLSSGSSESQKTDGTSKHNIVKDVQVTVTEEKRLPNLAGVLTDSDTESSDSTDYNELIKNINKHGLDDRNKENQNKRNKMYIFSSRPTCIDKSRTHVTRHRKEGMASAPARKVNGFDTKTNSVPRPSSETVPRSSGTANLDAGDDRDFDLSDVSHIGSLDHLPHRDNHLDAVNKSRLQSTVKSPRRQSINKKSLREIPAQELQRSGGQKPYSFTKYQMGDVTESFEQQMLLSMQRASCTDSIDSCNEQSLSHMGYDALTDSSDDLSTLKSPKLMKNRSHNYQEEILKLGQNFLTQSNPREWGEVFSPPIILPSSNSLQSTKNGQEAFHKSDLGHSKKHKDMKTRKELQNSDTDEELDLLYDPELHYFFDPRTTKYYELITPSSNPKTNIVFSK